MVTEKWGKSQDRYSWTAPSSQVELELLLIPDCRNCDVFTACLRLQFRLLY